jgi:hypothetical protein
VPWVARPWVARGAITEIDGKVKAAGKTTWALAMTRCVLDGALFMGEPTIRGPVVYLSEQPDTSLREALRRAGLLERDDLHILKWADTRGVPWPKVAEAAGAMCRETGAVLLIVDTLWKFAGIKGDDENSSGAAMEAMSPLQALAGENLTGIAVVRHDRKSGGDVGDSARGSSAFTGEADVVLSIRREGNQATRRRIEALGRFDETPDALVIELTEDGYISLGEKAPLKSEEVRNALIAVLPESEQEAQSPEELCRSAGIGKVTTTVKETLPRLVEEGVAGRGGRGVGGDPYHYWRLGRGDGRSEQVGRTYKSEGPSDQPLDFEEEGGDDTVGRLSLEAKKSVGRAVSPIGASDRLSDPIAPAHAHYEEITFSERSGTAENGVGSGDPPDRPHPLAENGAARGRFCRCGAEFRKVGAGMDGLCLSCWRQESRHERVTETR